MSYENWISTQERLPKKDCCPLVTFKSGVVDFANFQAIPPNNQKNYWVYLDENRQHEVIAWQIFRLPAAYGSQDY